MQYMLVTLMTITYYLQRKVQWATTTDGTPNQGPVAISLPSYHVQYKHFATLTGVNITSTLLTAFREKGQAILQFLVKEKWDDKNDARQIVEAVYGEGDPNLHQVAWAILTGLQSFFKVKDDALFLLWDVRINNYISFLSVPKKKIFCNISLECKN